MSRCRFSIFSLSRGISTDFCTALVGTSDGLCAWNLISGSVKREFLFEDNCANDVSAVAASSCAGMVAAGSNSGVITCWRYL